MSQTDQGSESSKSSKEASAPAPPPPPLPVPGKAGDAPGRRKNEPSEGTNSIQSKVRVTQVCHSQFLMDWLVNALADRAEGSDSPHAGQPLKIADFGPGWNPEAPVWVGSELLPQLEKWGTSQGQPERAAAAATAVPLVYALDLHEVRLMNLYNYSVTEGLSQNVRCVACRLETMMTTAAFVPNQLSDLKKAPGAPAITAAPTTSAAGSVGSVLPASSSSPSSKSPTSPSSSSGKEAGSSVSNPPSDVVVPTPVLNDLDKLLMAPGGHISRGAFHLGLLLNDMVGFLADYYKAYPATLRQSLVAFRQCMAQDGLLVVTQPCMLHATDNITALESVGFSFKEGLDIHLPTGTIVPITKSTPLKNLSTLHHFSVLLFTADGEVPES